MSRGDLSGLVEHSGRNDVLYKDPFLPGRAIKLWSACPQNYSPKMPLLFVHHGDLRNGREFRDFWLPLVDESQFLVVVSEFSVASFPGSEWYNLGNRIDADGRINPREEWTFGVPGRLLATLVKQGITARRSYGLFGHSSGGQFVHRLISLGFRNGVAAAATANAGTYAMPDLDISFPYGLGGGVVDEAKLREFLAFRLTIFAGTADIDTANEYFPSDDAAMRQGPTRYARAYTYIAAARTAAEKYRMSCAWTIVDVTDVGHDGRKMSAAAAPVLAAALHASKS